jgi:para-nitrobenzyl esterase
MEIFVPLVTLPAGAIEGVTLDSGALRFMNVPYAEPPVGELRFRPAVPRSPWRGVWDGTRPGATPPQAESWSPLHALGAEPGHIPGADILNLNVFTPSLEGAAPVAVYLHGGGFREGNGSLRMYDGANFARDGVVLVSINYRVGIEGFLYFEGGTPNLGFLDQVAALRWVQENIRYFGGDPGRVTIFGQSAGGASVSQLIAMPETVGLFHAAINQSGPNSMGDPAEDGLAFSSALAEVLGVDPTWAGFASVPPDDMIVALERLSGDIGSVTESIKQVHVGAVQDPEQVPWHATGNVADSFANPVPILGGFTAEEFLLFTWQRTDTVTDEGVRDRLAALPVDPDDALARLRAVDPTISAAAISRKLDELALFVGPMLTWLGAARSNDIPAWGYEFGWRTNAYDGAPGAYHVLDIPFEFDNLRMSHALQMTGENAPQDLADAIHGEWVHFMTNHSIDRPMYTDVESLRWFDTQTRESRGDTTAVMAALFDKAEQISSNEKENNALRTT